MDVALVGNIEAEAIYWRIKHAVQANCKLDHAKVGAYMTTIFRGRRYDAFANLLSKLLELLERKFFYVIRRLDLSEERHFVN